MNHYNICFGVMMIINWAISYFLRRYRNSTPTVSVSLIASGHARMLISLLALSNVNALSLFSGHISRNCRCDNISEMPAADKYISRRVLMIFYLRQRGRQRSSPPYYAYLSDGRRQLHECFIYISTHFTATPDIIFLYALCRHISKPLYRAISP